MERKPWGMVAAVGAGMLAIGITAGFFLDRGKAIPAEVRPETPNEGQLWAAMVPYLDPDEVNGLYPQIREMEASLEASGRPTARRDLMIGFIRLADDRERRTGERPRNVRFRGSYAGPYLAFRKPGMTHDQAIARLIEMEKF